MGKLMMKMKTALVGLMMGGLSAFMLRDWRGAAPGITPIEKAIRQIKRSSRYRPASNGCRPQVKRARRRAQAKQAQRRARRLGHA